MKRPSIYHDSSNKVVGEIETQLIRADLSPHDLVNLYHVVNNFIMWRYSVLKRDLDIEVKIVEDSLRGLTELEDVLELERSKTVYFKFPDDIELPNNGGPMLDGFTLKPI